MGSSRPTMRSVLAALDPGSGGRPSGTLEEIVEMLRAQGWKAENDPVQGILARLVAQRRVERIVTEDHETTYTRPDVLVRIAGVVTVVPNPNHPEDDPR